jgi:putative ABC transport system permease protein
MSWLRRLSNTFRTGRVRGDIDRELAFHIAERVEQLRAEGLTAEEATRRARIQFGNPAVQIERTRDVDVSGAADAFLGNLRYAFRALRRTPGFTFTVVLTLALGIGANSAVFSAIDGILLRPLPYADADRLVRINEVDARGVERFAAMSRLLDWNRLNTAFEGITGYTVQDGSDTTQDPPQRTQFSAVGPGFFELLGVSPALGRTFTAEDHRVGGPTAILLSDRFWRNSYNATPQVVGTTIRIRDVSGELSFPIVGVMRASFLFLDRGVGAWSPMKTDAPWMSGRLPYLSFVNAVGRLKPGVTLEQARSDLARVQAQLGAQYPNTDRDLEVRVTPLKASVIGNADRSLWLLFAAVTVLLLIACTNIVALLLARGAQREQEVAVRYALGGGRVAVAMQLLTEAIVLAVAGAAAGLIVAAGAAAGLRWLAPDLPRLDEAGLDARTLVYTATAAIIAALACGLVPAIRSSRRDGTLARSSGTRVSSRHGLQWLLVGTQVALSVTLLAGAGLLLRSFDALSRVDPGFDDSHVLAFRVYADYGREAPPQVARRIDRTLDALEAMPGIETIATAFALPGVPAQTEETFSLVERRTDADATLVAQLRGVSPGYFRTLGIPTVSGDTCGRVDPAAAAAPTGEVMVNRRFVEHYLAGRPAVGLHLARGSQAAGRVQAAYTGVIVGVVGDARELGIDRDPVPTVYQCMNSNPMPWYLARTTGEPAVLAAAVRLKVRDLEPLRAVYDLAPMRERIGDAYAQNRMRTVLLSLFAATALSLTCLGVYGTLSYVVRLRRREIGLRLALGAARSGILRQFIAQGLRVAIAACACGLGLSLLFTRLLSGMLYGVTASDPTTLSGVVAVVLATSVLAALIPAARAALLQPMRILRDE